MRAVASCGRPVLLEAQNKPTVPPHAMAAVMPFSHLPHVRRPAKSAGGLNTARGWPALIRKYEPFASTLFIVVFPRRLGELQQTPWKPPCYSADPVGGAHRP